MLEAASFSGSSLIACWLRTRRRGRRQTMFMTRRKKILQSMASIEPDDDGSATPKPLMFTAQPAVGSEDTEEASTFRLDIQPAWDGSRSTRETVWKALMRASSRTAAIPPRLVLKKNEGGWMPPSPDTQWDPEGPEMASPTQAIIVTKAGEPNTSKYNEEDEVFFLA